MQKEQKIVVGLSILSCFILHFISYAPYGEYPHNLSIFSSFFVFITIYPLIFYKKISNLFITPFITLNWIYFQSPFLLAEKTKYYTRIILAEYIPEIALYTSLAIPLIYIGYFYFFNHVKPISSKDYKFSNQDLRKLTLLFVFLSILYRLGLAFYPDVTNSLSNIIQLLFYSPIIAFALYSLFLMRTNTKPKLSFFHIITIGYLVIEFLLRISTTMFISTALLFSGVLLAYYYEKRKIPITLILVASIILIPFYLSRKYYRAISENKEVVNISQLERGQVFFEKAFSDNGVNYTERVERKTIYQKNRFENLSLISQVVYQHRKLNRPFLYGETFYWLPLAPIPRIIFPSKPENLMATEVATSYGLRGNDSPTAINFPMLVEAYINFDFIGILFLVLCFGMGFKWFVMKFGMGLGDINLIIIINCIKQLIEAEGNITLVFGALIQVFIFWYLLLYFFKLIQNNSHS